MPIARSAIVVVTLASALALVGCKPEEGSMVQNAKSAQPLSPQLVSLMAEKQMSPQDPMLLRIFKEESKAEVWKKRRSDGRYALLKSYDICRFSGKLGPKIKEGDKQAPEGFYSVTPAQMNPKSSYYLSFNIGFPNAYDKALGRSGQHVMMHGDCLSAGCYAMTDAQIGEIYAMARESFRGGQPAFQVQALPFRMTPQNLARRRNDKNMAFWKNLKQGSDNFEVTKLEPKVDACGKKYVFNAKPGALSRFEPAAGCPSYQVDPQIAKAVSAKEKADNMVLAQLSKVEPIAAEYVAQNGRMRRTLDQPVVMMAALAPEAVGVQVAASRTESGGMTLASATPAQTVQGMKTGSVSTTGTVTVKPAAPETTTVVAEAAPAEKSDSSLFTRMFRSDEQAARTPITETMPTAQTPIPATSVASPAAAAAARPVSAASDADAVKPREIVAQQPPVMASSAPETGFKIKGWVGGLFGGKPAEESAAAASRPAGPSTPVSDTPAPAGQKNRSASLPKEFAPRGKTDGKPDARITSSFAAFD